MKKQITTPAPTPAPAPCSPPTMPGAHNYHGAPTLTGSPAAILLAQVAAPFAAAGSNDKVAIARAHSLLTQCDEFLFQQEYQELLHHPVLTLTLAAAEKDLKRTRKTVKDYLIEAVGADAAETMWTDARRGSPVFDGALMKKLRAKRDAAYQSRGKRAATSGEK